MTAAAPTKAPLSLSRIVRTWWPLAASWLVMTAEFPLTTAVIARLAEPEINLAAWGVAFSVTAIIQAPAVMLLAASTALSRDRNAYVKLRLFMLGIGVLLTTLHALLAFTPLYYVFIDDLISAPPDIIEPTRLGLMIMTPWAWSTGYRRFEQGVLIRFDHARAVIWGSLIRLATDSLVLSIGYALGSLPGIVVAAAAIILGAAGEAIYAGLRVRPVVSHQFGLAAPTKAPLTFIAFQRFYAPLALTTLLTMLLQPLVSAALSRMPHALESLAVWPVIFGLLMIWQSVGIAYNEVVIALLDEPQAVPKLRRFTLALGVLMTALLLAMTATPLATLWFRHVAALPSRLVPLAQHGLWLALLVPALRIVQSWCQGILVYSRKTATITESVVISLTSSGLVLLTGVAWGGLPGLIIGLAAFVVGLLLQDVWLWHRSRPSVQTREKVDALWAPPE